MPIAERIFGRVGAPELPPKSSCFLPLRPTVAAYSSQYSEPDLSSARRESAMPNGLGCATRRSLVEFFATTVARLRVRMLEVTMNSPATARPPGRSRLALIVAGVLALLGSLAVTAPAQAGYYDDSEYGSDYGSEYGSDYAPAPCSSPCGYRYYAPRYYNRCSACGCYRRCGSYSRGAVYERRYIEREYVERRYGYGGCGYGGCRRPYGYDGGYGRPYGYDGGYRRPYGYDGGYRRPYGSYPYGGYRSWSTRRYPWGWGGVRSWRGPYGFRYEPTANKYAEAPRPPASIE